MKILMIWSSSTLLRLVPFLCLQPKRNVRLPCVSERVMQQPSSGSSKPTDEQIAAQMGMDVVTIQQVKSANYRVLSLDKAVSGHDDSTLGDLIPDERIPAYDDLLCQEEDERELPEQVQAMLACLTERE